METTRAMAERTVDATPSKEKPRLSVELVPASCWFSNVRSHVTRKVWDQLRRQTYEAAGHVCEICGGVGRKHPVECHEIWHYDDEKHIQRLERLIALCPRCHAVKHFGLSILRGWEEGATRHLCNINGWEMNQAQAYLQRSFGKHRERSAHQWTLDLTYLEKLGVTIKPKR